jgi:sulfur carrier protein
VQVSLNGRITDVPDDVTVAHVVAEHSGGHGRVAVARNGDVVPRSSWARTRLFPGDVLEVLAPTAGG